MRVSQEGLIVAALMFVSLATAWAEYSKTLVNKYGRWIGYGWSKYVRAAYSYLPRDVRREFNARGSSLRGNHHLHADILNLGVAGGLLGLGAYGLILLAPLLGAFRSVRDGQYAARVRGAVLLAVGYAACGVTYLMFGYEFHTTLYVCLAAIVLGFCRDAPPERESSISPAA